MLFPDPEFTCVFHSDSAEQGYQRLSAGQVWLQSKGGRGGVLCDWMLISAVRLSDICLRHSACAAITQDWRVLLSTSL